MKPHDRLSFRCSRPMLSSMTHISKPRNTMYPESVTVEKDTLRGPDVSRKLQTAQRARQKPLHMLDH